MKKLFTLLLFIFVTAMSFGQIYTLETSDNSGYFKLNSVEYPKAHFGITYDGNISVEAERSFTLYNIFTGEQLITSRHYSEVTGVTTWDGLIKLLSSIEAIEASVDVNIQDQTTPIIIASMSKEHASSTIAASPTVINDLSFDVADATGFVTGNYLSIFSVPDNRFYLANILNVVSNTITVDTALDFAYPIGSFVTAGIKNMNVDGSSTAQVFGIRNTTEVIGSAFDITRIIVNCLASSTIDLSMFGNIAGGLVRGIVLRKVDGTYMNIFNAKTNANLKSLMFDFQIEPAQGNQQDGFTGRLTFSGQSKMGVAIRLEPGEDLQLIVQDDLTSLTFFGITAEGHIVENGIFILLLFYRIRTRKNIAA